jgi:hypothetical protein
MVRRFLLTAFIVLPILFVDSALATQSAAEDVKSRPNRQEIADLMVQNRLPGPQQNSKIDQIMADQAGSKTPRSDFMFCTGLAYLGNAKAQACVAKAYEIGLGVVEDLSEAYTWYALACETRIADAAEEHKVEETRDQLKLRLLSVYPHPTEEELDDQVNAQKTRIAQYQAEIQKTNK